ncbi:MAG: hypothetical protein M3458_13185 [Acidobacteriota bacterium]|nr:hypothetical protein [Acidobacteriota bacterium]
MPVLMFEFDIMFEFDMLRLPIMLLLLIVELLLLIIELLLLIIGELLLLVIDELLLLIIEPEFVVEVALAFILPMFAFVVFALSVAVQPAQRPTTVSKAKRDRVRRIEFPPVPSRVRLLMSRAGDRSRFRPAPPPQLGAEYLAKGHALIIAKKVSIKAYPKRLWLFKSSSTRQQPSKLPAGGSNRENKTW